MSPIAGMFRQEAAERERFFYVALCWITCYLSFQSCKPSTIGPLCPLRNSIMSRTMCGNQKTKRCGSHLHYQKKIISDMRETQFLGSLLFANQFLLETEFQNLRQRMGLPTESVPLRGSFLHFQNHVNLLQMTQGMGISPPLKGVSDGL